MSDIYFYSDEDSGEGTLRSVISNSTRDDVIMPSPDLFVDGECWINVQTAMPNLFMRRHFSAGGAGKLILDGGFATKLTNTPSTTYEVYGIYDDIVFQGFVNDSTSAGNGTLFCYYVGNLTFNRCAFWNNSCGYRGCINLPSSTGNITFVSCIAAWNEGGSTSYGSLLTQMNSSPSTFTGCTFARGNGYAMRGSSTVDWTIQDCLIERYYITSAVSTNFTDDVVNFADGDFHLVADSDYITGATIVRTDYDGLQVPIGGSIGAFQFVDNSTKWWRFKAFTVNAWDIWHSVNVENVWRVVDVTVDQEMQTK